MRAAAYPPKIRRRCRRAESITPIFVHLASADSSGGLPGSRLARGIGEKIRDDAAAASSHHAAYWRRLCCLGQFRRPCLGHSPVDPFYWPPVGLVRHRRQCRAFSPIGLFRRRLSVSLFCPRKRQLWVLVGATLLSTSAEFLQIYSHGRFPSASDIGCNVLGATLG